MAEEPKDINNGTGDGDEVVKLEIPKKEYDKLVEEHAISTQSVTSLTSEIKDIRTKKQEAEEKLKEALKVKNLKPLDKPKEGEGEGLSKEEAAEIAAKAAKTVVEEAKTEGLETLREETTKEFKNSKQQFAEDNDPAGIKWAVFENKLAMFDMSSVDTKEKILEVLNSAFNLLPIHKNETVENTQTPSSTPSDPGGGGPPPANPDNLSSREKAIVDRVYGGDAQKFLKQKASKPEYIRELLRWEG